MLTKKSDFIYVDESTPGYSRKGSVGSFSYVDMQGNLITDNGILIKIESLKIPPMWKKVWIAPDTTMHLQAYGYDSSGRKQYIYHSDWVKINENEKYEKVFNFGIHLPALRNSVSQHLKKNKWDKDKVSALAVAILDRHFLRIGNIRYSNHNETYGISTLKLRHINEDLNDFKIIYKAKGG